MNFSKIIIEQASSVSNQLHAIGGEDNNLKLCKSAKVSVIITMISKYFLKIVLRQIISFTIKIPTQR